jgi:hypothetical protein
LDGVPPMREIIIFHAITVSLGALWNRGGNAFDQELMPGSLAAIVRQKICRPDLIVHVCLKIAIGGHGGN